MCLNNMIFNVELEAKSAEIGSKALIAFELMMNDRRKWRTKLALF